MGKRLGFALVAAVAAGGLWLPAWPSAGGGAGGAPPSAGRPREDGPGWPSAGAAGGAAPGSANGQKTQCTFASTITLGPGLSVVPSTGTFSSGGETGTVTCDGPVRGIVPTGPGTLGVEGRYGTKDPD